MKYLFNDLEKIKHSLSGRNIFLFFDYDGTLSQIVAHPDEAAISEGIKTILNKIAEIQRFKIAIISGRKLKDLRKKINIKGIIYSGSHGWEIEGPDLKYENDIPAFYIKMLHGIKQKLQKALSGYPGVFIEDKKLILGIHYRMANKRSLPKINKLIQKVIFPYLEAEQIKERTGKMVFEIIPPSDWNKGHAVLWLLSQPEFAKGNFYPVYFGDDITDEDAFRALKHSGLTVVVGNQKRSAAQYYLNNVEEVEKFLEGL